MFAVRGALAMLPGIAVADPGDAIDYSLRQAFAHDDNVFRIAAGDPPPAGSGQRSDRSSVTDVAAAFDQRYGIQQVRLGVGVSALRYRHNTQLDSDDVSGSAAWLWRSGNRLNGEISWSRREAQTSLADLDALVGNTATTTTTALSGNYWFHSDWTLGSGIASTRSENSLDSIAAAGSTSQSLSPYLQYRPRSGNTLTLRHGETRTGYPDTGTAGGSGNDFRQSETGLELAYAASGRTALSLQASRVSKRYQVDTARNFDGWTGGARWSWTPTGKLGVSMSAQRTVSNQDDPRARSTVTDGLSGGLDWSINSRWTAGATLARSIRDILGDGQAVTERTNQMSLTTSYSLLTSLRLVLDAVEERREAGDAVRGFRSRRTTISLAWSF